MPMTGPPGEVSSLRDRTMENAAKRKRYEKNLKLLCMFGGEDVMPGHDDLFKKC